MPSKAWHDAAVLEGGSMRGHKYFIGGAFHGDPLPSGWEKEPTYGRRVVRVVLGGSISTYDPAGSEPVLAASSELEEHPYNWVVAGGTRYLISDGGEVVRFVVELDYVHMRNMDPEHIQERVVAEVRAKVDSEGAEWLHYEVEHPPEIFGSRFTAYAYRGA